MLSISLYCSIYCHIFLFFYCSVYHYILPSFYRSIYHSIVCSFCHSIYHHFIYRSVYQFIILAFICFLILSFYHFTVLSFYYSFYLIKCNFPHLNYNSVACFLLCHNSISGVKPEFKKRISFECHLLLRRSYQWPKANVSSLPFNHAAIFCWVCVVLLG